MKDISQTELIDSAINGHLDSFGILCDMYYNSMVALAYAILSDHHLAEDAAQETFARAIRSLNKLKNKKKFAPWLAQICRNVAIDMAKKRAKTPDPENLQPVENKFNDDELQIIRIAVAGLSPTERELITMRYYNSLSHKQMSATLGLSRPAVNNRLSRARKKLAKSLKNHHLSEVRP